MALLENTKPSMLRATYKSPSTTKSFDHPQSSIPAESANADPGYIKTKTAYLSKLRSSTKELQEEINVFLTEKMEQDKAAAASADDTPSKLGKSKEEREEEMYGEENVDEEG